MSASHSLNIPRGECASSSCKTEMMRDSEIFLLNIALDSYNNCEDNLFRKKLYQCWQQILPEIADSSSAGQ